MNSLRLNKIAIITNLHFNPYKDMIPKAYYYHDLLRIWYEIFNHCLNHVDLSKTYLLNTFQIFQGFGYFMHFELFTNFNISLIRIYYRIYIKSFKN